MSLEWLIQKGAMSKREMREEEGREKAKTERGKRGKRTRQFHSRSLNTTRTTDGQMAKITYRPIEPKCCCCKVSSFLKSTYVSIIVLSLCTLVWAIISFFFHSPSSLSTFEQLLYQAYYGNETPYLPMMLKGVNNLKMFDLITSITGIISGLVIFVALLRPNNCTLTFARIFVLFPMCMITIQNLHFVSGAYGVPLTKETEQMGLVIVMLFLTLFVINFFTILNLFFSFILLCRLPTSPLFHRLH